VPLDSTTWAALALVLAACGAGYTYVAYRRDGIAGGVRGTAWTLLPVAAWLTGTLRLAGNVVDDVTAWAARLVFNPFTWLGIILAGVSVVLFGASSVMKRREIGTRPRPAKDKQTKQLADPRTKAPKQEQLVEDDIAAILKKHGIS
jgi:hypothetical protein